MRERDGDTEGEAEKTVSGGDEERCVCVVMRKAKEGTPEKDGSKKEKNTPMDVTVSCLSCFYSLHGCLSLSLPFSRVSVTQRCHSPNLGGRVEGFFAPASCSWHGSAGE